MSRSGLGFGGFLLGLGLGWYLFQYIDFSFELVSYFLIIMGIAMILGALLRKGGREHPISSVLGGVIGGLILATFITQGFGFIFNITDNFDDFGNYRASDTFSLNTQLSGEPIELNIDSVNGGVDVNTWSGDSVRFDIELRAKGSSQNDAENNIDNFEHQLSSNINQGIQEISLSFPISNQDWNLYSVAIDVYVPSSYSVSYLLETTNGEITFTDIDCDDIIIQTTNGAIRLNNVIADSIEARTTNGLIEGNIETMQSNLKTTNGGVDISLAKISGTHIFGTTNGGIDINLQTGNDVGYKFDLETSVGIVDVNLSNIDYSVNQARSKRGETSDYSTNPIQIEITADTSIGGININ